MEDDLDSTTIEQFRAKPPHQSPEVLIAAVTVNCLVAAINGEAATDKAAVPYIDMLLPPFEDVPDNSKDAATKNKVTAKVKTEATTTTTTKKPTTTTTTKKSITNEVNNSLPELSIEALLPPLFEAKTEQEETKKTTTQKPTTTTTTTTRRPTTTTAKTTTTTAKPTTTTTTRTTVQPSKLEVPDLFLDSLLPPLLDNNIVDGKEEKVAVTTQKPSLSFKTTKKSYYQQQQTQQLKDQKQQQLKHLQASTSKEVKNYNKPAATISAADKHVAESKTQTKQVPLTTHKQNIKLQSKIETMAKQHVAKQVAQQRHSIGNTQHDDKQFNNNYSFDLYFGSTTARPAKSGLPTITPFPHRLGR
ncbi:salivary glue protein Sgs-3-like [Calliphora vicina]|uniref:salivary glue protein Sgs-3-like n=1 Tax=Calliphora vicina TaxID=7373 RepID=UPI00325BB9C5